MANGRFLSASIRQDHALGTLSQSALLLFLMTIPHLDRDGLISGDPTFVWATAAPLRKDLLPEAEAAVQQWCSAGLTQLYTTDGGEPVLWFCGFAKNQQGMRYDREKPSRFPPPPGQLRTNSGLTPDCVGSDAGRGTAQDQDQGEDQDQVQDQSDDDGLRPLIQELIDFVGWKDAKTATTVLGNRELVDFSTWAWAYQWMGTPAKHRYTVDYDAATGPQKYSDHPFRKARNHAGYAVAAVRQGDAFPLDSDDQAALSDWLIDHSEGAENAAEDCN